MMRKKWGEGLTSKNFLVVNATQVCASSRALMMKSARQSCTMSNAVEEKSEL